MPQRYLAGLSLHSRRVVLIGGGRVAARRLPLLLDCGADVHVVSPVLHPAVADQVRAGACTHQPREYRDGDLAGAWYVMAATDDPAVNAQVVAEATRLRVFCVRADDGRAGTAATPATAMLTDGAQVAVLGGGDHRRSRALRDRVVEVLDGGEVGQPAARSGAKRPVSDAQV